jgi:hypothetical protein
MPALVHSAGAQQGQVVVGVCGPHPREQLEGIKHGAGPRPEGVVEHEVDHALLSR